MQAVIETTSITKLYGVVIGVGDVTVSLPPGVHGLLGPNGAGKSTLLKLLTGQLRPTEGEVRVLGERPWGNPGLFHRIGFCPEQDAFYTFLTGYEFVHVLARMSRLGPTVARERTEQALERVGALDFMHRKIATYSKGMRQRVKVAQAIVHQPELIILDEPLSGTDPLGRRELISLVGELGGEGKSILVSSHVLHEVQAMTQDFLLMHGGRVLASGSVPEIRGLMNEYPHRITIRCDNPRELGHAMMRELPISGVEMDESRAALSVLTRDPGGFYADFPRVALDAGVRIEELSSEDDNLESVFKYLVEAI